MRFDLHSKKAFKPVKVTWSEEHELKRARSLAATALNLLLVDEALTDLIKGDPDYANPYTASFKKLNGLSAASNVVQIAKTYTDMLGYFMRSKEATSLVKRPRHHWSENDMRALEYARKLKDETRKGITKNHDYYTEILAWWYANNDVLQVVLTLEKGDFDAKH